MSDLEVTVRGGLDALPCTALRTHAHLNAGECMQTSCMTMRQAANPHSEHQNYVGGISECTHRCLIPCSSSAVSHDLTVLAACAVQS